MIEFNGKQYSGAVLKNDSEELIITVYTNETLQDLCLSLNGVKNVSEITTVGTNVYNVNTAIHISSASNGVHTITFSKKISALEELSNAVDELLVMVLGGSNV